MNEQNLSFTIPQSWKSALFEIPEFFRKSIEIYAVKKYESVLLQDFRGRNSSEKHISAESLGLSSILFCASIPYHLIPKSELVNALSLLETNGPSDLVKTLREKWTAGSEQGCVLVIGDLPKESHLFLNLDQILGENNYLYIIAGPGPQIEPILRSYISKKIFPKSHLKSIDQTNGKIWDSAPGPALELLVEKLLKEFRPTKVLAFEPVRLPSTQIAIEMARQFGIDVICIEAPLITETI